MNISISIIICSTLLLYKKSRYVSHKAGEDHSYSLPASLLSVNVEFKILIFILYVD